MAKSGKNTIQQEHQSLIDKHKSEVKQAIGEYLNINEEGIEEIFNTLAFKSYEAGSVLLEPGQVSHDCCMILKGCVRQYHIQDGVEKTTFFFTENQWFASYHSAANKKPVRHYLECLEDTLLSIMNIDSENELNKKYPEFESATRAGIKRQLESYEEMMVTFMSSTPQQRYQNVLNNRPYLLQRVPQYQLASYLGITPESLSRIRKRLSTQKKF